MGHLLTHEGVKVDGDKIKAIEEMEEPKNISQLKTFLGMVNYLAKFLPNISNVTEKLRELEKKHVEWHWNSEH